MLWVQSSWDWWDGHQNWLPRDCPLAFQTRNSCKIGSCVDLRTECILTVGWVLCVSKAEILRSELWSSEDNEKINYAFLISLTTLLTTIVQWPEDRSGKAGMCCFTCFFCKLFLMCRLFRAVASGWPWSLRHLWECACDKMTRQGWDFAAKNRSKRSLIMYQSM